MKRPLVTFGIFAAICLALIPYWAIAREGKESSAPQTVASEYAAGEELFQINCGACHTLAAAGTDGVIGPNLDILLGSQPTSADTIKANRSRVLNAVENGINNVGLMPAGIVQGAQADEVADFVAHNVHYLPASPAP